MLHTMAIITDLLKALLYLSLQLAEQFCQMLTLMEDSTEYTRLLPLEVQLLRLQASEMKQKFNT
jgi:hypothetical protein